MAVALGALAACGLDESGLAPIDGGGDSIVVPEGGADVVADVAPDVPLPPSCATTDLSCLGFDAGAPDGWAPYVVALGDAGCPSGDYTGSAWVTNPSVASGCSCSCTPSGSWTCPSTLTVKNGLNCGSTSTVNPNQCTAQTSAHIEVDPVAATNNNVTCSADASAPVTIAESLSLCAPGCDAGAQGLCAQPSGSRCIVAEGVQACPDNSFTQHVVGASATGSCAPCSCDIGAAPSCNAAATVYYGYGNFPNHTADDKCQTGGQFTTQQLSLNGTCQAANDFYDSFTVAWTPLGETTCTTSGGGGDAGLSSPKTVCCK